MRALALAGTPKRIALLVPLAGALAVAGCSQESVMRRLTPHDADVRARDYLALLVRGRTDSAEARLAPSVRDQNTHAAIAQLASVLAGQVLDSMHVIAVRVNTFSGAATMRYVGLGYEFHTPHGWFAADVSTVDSAGAWLVEGLHVDPLADKLERVNAFTLTGRSPLHYVVFLLAIACAVLSLGVAWLVAFRSRMRRRWLWALVALVGVGQVMLNWTTGEIGERVLSVLLLGAGVMRGAPAAPWIVSFSFPVGALIAFERYRRWRRRADTGTFANGLVFPTETADSTTA